MRILEIILPVLVMLVLGMACRKLKLLTKSGIDNMKLLVTNIMLPVAIFHALATADYSVKTWKLVGIMFVMLVASFGVGFLLKPLYERRIPQVPAFMVSVWWPHGVSFVYQSVRAGKSLTDRSTGYCRTFVWIQHLYGDAGTGGKRREDQCKETMYGDSYGIYYRVLGILAGLSKVVIT